MVLSDELPLQEEGILAILVLLQAPSAEYINLLSQKVTEAFAGTPLVLGQTETFCSATVSIFNALQSKAIH